MRIRVESSNPCPVCHRTFYRVHDGLCYHCHRPDLDAPKVRIYEPVKRGRRKGTPNSGGLFAQYGGLNTLAKSLGLSRSTLSKRLSYGWTIDQAAAHRKYKRVSK